MSLLNCIPGQGSIGKLGGAGRASGRAEWSLEVNGWSLEG